MYSFATEIKPQTSVLASEYNLGPRHNFPQQPFSVLCSPQNGDDILIQSSSKCVNLIQTAVGEMLAMPSSKFHFKSLPGDESTLNSSRGSLYTVACALACHQLRRRVRFELPALDSLRITGKQMGAMKSLTKVQLNSTGFIERLFCDYYTDCGISTNELNLRRNVAAIGNCYKSEFYNLNITAVRTDTPSNSNPRFDFEPICVIENIMEHISFALKLDPVEVRLRNMNDKAVIHSIYQQLIESSEFYRRKEAIDGFNEVNLWRKRGISSMPMTSVLTTEGHEVVEVRIIPSDGSCLIKHGGGGEIKAKLIQIVLQEFRKLLRNMITVQVDPQLSGGGEDLQIVWVSKSSMKNIEYSDIIVIILTGCT